MTLFGEALAVVITSVLSFVIGRKCRRRREEEQEQNPEPPQADPPRDGR
jgi:hypothetical protein